MSKFVITPKEDKTVTMTIRIDANLQEEYNKLSLKTNRSRNELINMALQYALDNMEIIDCVAKTGCCCPSSKLWKKLFDGINEILDGVTLKDISEGKV